MEEVGKLESEEYWLTDAPNQNLQFSHLLIDDDLLISLAKFELNMRCPMQIKLSLRIHSRRGAMFGPLAGEDLESRAGDKEIGIGLEVDNERDKSYLHTSTCTLY